MSIFSSGYVIRDASGWKITDAGRAFPTSIEAPALIEAAAIELAAAPALPQYVVQLADQERRGGRAAA